MPTLPHTTKALKHITLSRQTATEVDQNMTIMFSFVFIYIAFAALLTVVSANSVQVNNLDFHQPYELCWVPNAGQPAIHTPVLEPRTSQYVRLPYSWAGAIHAIYSGGGEAACDRHAVIAELTFQGFEGKTWYDVSAVDNLNDNTAVHYLYPEFCNDGPVSGCDTFPCSNSYYKDGLPADDQGHATTCLDLVLAFGNAPLTWLPFTQFGQGVWDGVLSKFV